MDSQLIWRKLPIFIMYQKTGKLSSRQMKTETVFVLMLANEQARPIFCEGKGGEIVDVVVE